MIILIKFNTMPALIISAILTSPLPKTMALGGVATGSIKAHEADNVAEIIRSRGCTLMETARDPSRGRIISKVARSASHQRDLSQTHPLPLVKPGNRGRAPHPPGNHTVDHRNVLETDSISLMTQKQGRFYLFDGGSECVLMS